MRILLTDVAIKRLTAPPTGQLKVWDTKLPGFGIIIGKRTRTFYAVYGQNRRNHKIGRYPDISLKDARTAAKVLLATKPRKTAQEPNVWLSVLLLTPTGTTARSCYDIR